MDTSQLSIPSLRLMTSKPERSYSHITNVDDNRWVPGRLGVEDRVEIELSCHGLIRVDRELIRKDNTLTLSASELAANARVAHVSHHDALESLPEQREACHLVLGSGFRVLAGRWLPSCPSRELQTKLPTVQDPASSPRTGPQM